MGDIRWPCRKYGARALIPLVLWSLDGGGDGECFSVGCVVEPLASALVVRQSARVWWVFG